MPEKHRTYPSVVDILEGKVPRYEIFACSNRHILIIDAYEGKASVNGIPVPLIWKRRLPHCFSVGHGEMYSFFLWLMGDTLAACVTSSIATP